MNSFDNTVQMVAENLEDKEFLSKVINDYVKNNSSSSDKPVRTSISSKNFFNREDVLKSLSNIQQTYKPAYKAGQRVNINTDEFKISLLNSMAKLNKVAIPKTMNQIDGRTIDFVEMIFGAFLRDKNLSDATKNLLLKLQIPVIKTSLIDHNFFYDNEHTARKLLDTVAYIGIGIEDEENTVYKTIELIIDQLLRSYEQNSISFRTALTALQRLRKIETSNLEKNESDTRISILKEHARQLVLSELQYYTMNIKIPKSIQPLLLNNWSTYMFTSYLKFGKSSLVWQDSIDTLNIISKSLKPINSMAEWTSLKDNYQEIVNIVKDCLFETKQNKEKSFIATTNLKRHYEKTINNSEYFEEKSLEKEDDQSLKDSVYADKSQDKLSPVEITKKSAQSLIAELPEYVRPGVWFKIFTSESTPVRRLKLSLITNETAKLIFVDRKGQKIIEKDANDFCYELLNDQSSMIEDHSVFDFALSQVISNISQSNVG